jgi:hypothetical protein
MIKYISEKRRNLELQAGNVTSKHERVIRYRNYHHLRAITVRSDNDSDDVREIIIISDYWPYRAKATTFRSAQSSDVQSCVIEPVPQGAETFGRSRYMKFRLRFPDPGQTKVVYKNHNSH